MFVVLSKTSTVVAGVMVVDVAIAVAIAVTVTVVVKLPVKNIMSTLQCL